MKQINIKYPTAYRLLLIIFPLFCVICSLFIGRYALSVTQVLKALWGGNQVPLDNLTVVWQLRLPRAIAAAFVGAALSASGAAFQGVFRNPLVNSSILGVSNGAGLGACIAIVFFGGGFLIYPFAFLCSFFAVGLAWAIGQICGKNQSITLVLGGVIVTNFFGAFISILKYIADPYTQLPSITFWFMGSLSNINYHHFIAFIPMILGLGIIWVFRWRINVLSMGDKEALSLGVDVPKCKFMIVTGATLATASAVCISGAIGWVGLIIPHISRMLVGNDNVKLIPFSMSLGAGFLVIIDVLCRNLTQSEIPIGILTALIGTPFFVYLLKSTKGGVWQ